MKRITRRTFLRQGGASLAGVVLAGPMADALVRASAADAAARAAAADFPGPVLDTLSAVVADLERKFPYASALLTANEGTSIRRDRRGKGVSESQFVQRPGVSLRVFDGGTFHEATLAGQSPDDIHAAAKRLARDVSVGGATYTIEAQPKLERVWRTRVQVDPASVPLDRRTEAVDAEFERANWDDPRVRNTTINTTVQSIRRVFVDRTRRLASDTTMISHSLFMFGLDQGKPGFAFIRHVGQAGLELASFSDEEIEKARKQMVETFGAEQVQAGEYDVVFAPEVTGLLAHESFGHGVEMDQFVKHRARAQEYLGKKVASDIVSLYDDPSIEGARGSYPFDDEGLLAAPTQVITNGVFTSPLTDLMSATLLGTKRTPNGRTQGWDRKVYARMSNTFIGRGTSDPAELMDSLKDGLYLEGFRNGIEDPMGWGIQFTANMAREVKGGKFTGRVFVPATVTGYVPDILANITMVANDMGLDPGTCGKGFKEFVPVAGGGPHIRTRARVS